MELIFEYEIDDKTYQVNNTIFDGFKFENKDIFISAKFLDDIYEINLEPKTRLNKIKSYFKYDQDFNSKQHLFFNGYQSWTYSREHNLNAYNQALHRLPFKKYVLKKFLLDRYGDSHFLNYKNKHGFNRAFSYMYIRENDEYKLFGSLDEDRAFTYFEYEKGNPYILIGRDFEGIEVNTNICLFKFCVLKGLEDDVFDKWFNLMGIAKPNCNRMIGYSSWYNYYQNINESIIENDLDSIINSPIKSDIFQIDDGWERYVGDWLECDPDKFPYGFKFISEKIHSSNMKAGLWLAPFTVEKDSDIYKNHPDWLIKDENGLPYAGGSNWSGFYGLDIYNLEVREYIEKVFDNVFNNWHFDLVKLDFLYCACLKPIHNKTRGEIMADAMMWLRKLCKGKLILGCGVPLASAFGRVDYCRIGCDVSLDYDDVAYMHLAHPERNSTRQTMIDSIFRRQLNNRAFLNDPDVIILRKDNIKLNLKEKTTLAFINALFGSVLFVSDDVSKYDENQLKIFKKALRLRNIDKRVEVNNKEVIVSYVYKGLEEKIRISMR